MEDKEKDRKEALKKVSGPSPVDESRRSRGSPPRIQPEEGGSCSAIDDRNRKRPRPQQEEEDASDKNNAGSEVKVDPVTVNEDGEASSSFSAEDNTAQGRFETEGFGNITKEEPAHPCLFIENILDVIFKLIINQPGPRTNVGNDVQSIRQVCRTWKDSVTRVYRRQRPIIAFENYAQSPCRGTKSFAEFMDSMRLSDMIPVQKFQFRGRPFKHGSPKLFEDFFRIFGQEVALLEFQITPDDADNLSLSLKNLPDLNMPKLRTLEIHTIYQYQNRAEVKSTGNIRGIVNLITSLLGAATTLQEFVFIYCPPRPSSHSKEQRAVIQELGQAIVCRIPRTVKKLDLAMELKESAMNNLAETGLQLERFEFGGTSKLGARTLYNFLQSQAATLNSLHIWNFPDHRKGIFVQFPRLDELAQLELRDAIVSTDTGSEFARSFPKLRHLILSKMSTDTAILSLLSNVKEPMRQLEGLHLPVWRRTSLAPIIRNMSVSFPCLAELHIELYRETRETMEEVFRHFDNIELLRIRFFEKIPNCNWLYSILSGISEADCSTIRWRQDFGSVNLNELQRRPSILNLTKLTTLVVNVCGKNRWYSFDDFSAHFIFLEMDALREIHLKNSRVQFSPRYLDLLRDRLVLH